jgi:hypothetical protein
MHLFSASDMIKETVSWLISNTNSVFPVAISVDCILNVGFNVSVWQMK